jgi:hypothetical protein
MQSTKPQILFPTLTIIFCCYESNHNQQSERTSKEKEKSFFSFERKNNKNLISYLKIIWTCRMRGHLETSPSQ